MRQTTGFKSFVYRSGYVYNFVNQRAFEFKKKFKTLATIACRNGAKKVLDLPCGTGYLTRYLEPYVIYEGWDLNQKFLTKIRKDWHKGGRIKPKKVILRQKNIFSFDEYPDDVDVIVFCDILHHVFPKHEELVENAKNHAKKIIICEPFAAHPKGIQGADWVSRITLKIVKFFPEKLLKFMDYFFADNDGVNKYSDRSQWQHDREGLKDIYRRMGIADKRIYSLNDEIIGVWEA